MMQSFVLKILFKYLKSLTAGTHQKHQKFLLLNDALEKYPYAHTPTPPNIHLPID
ncbi:MAG: hypothetical protein RL023_665 [Candidatus Parcubacteria bacterium]